MTQVSTAPTPELLPRTTGWRFWRRARARKPTPSSIAQSALITILATLAYLAIAEIIVRVVVHAPLLGFPDFRHDRAARYANPSLEYDSLLGWRLRPDVVSNWLNTIEYGLRSNGGTDKKAQQGGVLAVGSSYTIGSEVVDSESWPAQLEQLSGWPVNNAGSGGYQADQAIMFAEQLLPLLHPQVVIVDLIPDNVVGNEYSSYGWWKPYFTIENGKLVHHNNPVPVFHDPGLDRFGIKPFFGHFAAVDRFMMAFFQDSWFSGDGSRFIRIDNDSIGVTCLLLRELKDQTDQAGVRLFVHLHFAGQHISGAGGREPVQSAGVNRCANEFAIPVIDEFAALTKIFEENPDELRRRYMKEPDGSSGHNSPYGNRQVATRIMTALKESGISIPQRSK